MAEDQIHIVITVVGEPEYIEVYREQIEYDIRANHIPSRIQHAIDGAVGGVHHYVSRKVEVQ